MLTRCHACGATASLDVLVTNEDTKHALNAVFALSGPLGKSTIRYLALFRPAQRVLSHARMATLLSELLPFMEAGSIPRKGRDWPVAVADWVQAVELTLQARDAGKLTLPLTSHGYLFEVLCSLADRAERLQEETREASRRSRGQEAAPASAATVTVRGAPTNMGDALQTMFGGRDPALVQLESRAPNPLPPAPPASQAITAGTSFLVRQMKQQLKNPL
ncbi:hypothetical protein [Polaromonas sp.]|uniref:hypothetical protein n=1 Tax=Polaromonas sp. TaxID=1869339 RepID=UPI003BB805EF